MSEVIHETELNLTVEGTLGKRDSTPVDATLPPAYTQSRASEGHSYNKRADKQKSSNNLPPSPVLLVCIYNNTGKIITHDYFYENFSPFGEIVKILIFEKAKVWKTFVEFRNVEQAEHAK